jgi:hypothetical protein
MKKITLILFFTSTCLLRADAQFLGGFFSQQSQKRRIMGEQIVDLQVYQRILESGYHTVNNGLRVAEALKGGTYDLHQAYFNKLRQVSLVVSADPRAKAIDELGARIMQLFAAEINWQQHQHMLSQAEMAYLLKVSDHMRAELRQGLVALTDVLTPGKLTLSDHERLERLDQLYASMKDKYAFAGSFTAKCRKLAAGRLRSQKENRQLQKLYGIN